MSDPETPENLVLHLLRKMDRKIDDFRTELKSDMDALRTELKSDMQSLRGEMKSDMQSLRAESAKEHQITRDQVAGLRRAVMEYHSSVIGHGVLITELDDRLRRVEQHLNLPPQH